MLLAGYRERWVQPCSQYVSKRAENKFGRIVFGGGGCRKTQMHAQLAIASITVCIESLFIASRMNREQLVVG